MRLFRVALFLSTTFLVVACTSTFIPRRRRRPGAATVEGAEVGGTAVDETTSPASAPHATVAVSQPTTSAPHLGLYCVLPTLPGGGITSCITMGSIPTCSSPVIVGTGPCWIDGTAAEATPAGKATGAQNVP